MNRQKVCTVVGLFLSTLIAACAVPVPPTGGPPDQDPPRIVSSTPEDGSVNQIVDRIVFEFNERVDEASVRQSLSIVPEFAERLEVRVSGNRVTVLLPEAVRENTTYIVTLDTRMRDAHSVTLKQPLTVAFGTGPDINRGRLRGNVLQADNGSPSVGIDVFAYAADPAVDINIDRPPDYRTQTDDLGNFEFSYLSEQPYFILAVRDANSNRSVDPSEATAIPPVASISADSVGDAPARPWIVSRIDAQNPELLQVRARSVRELELRFSEPIVMQDTVSSGWIVADSLSHERNPVELMYKGNTVRDVILRLASGVDRAHYVTGTAALVDSSGNAVAGSDTVYFRPSADPFDPAFSFLGFSPDSLEESANGYFRVWPQTNAGIRFTAPPGPAWAEWVSVTDTSGTAVTYTSRTRDNVLFELFGSEIPGPVRVSVQSTDSTSERLFAPAGPSVLGDLAGVVSTSAQSNPVVVELIRDDVNEPIVYTQLAAADGTFLFTGLPGASRYVVRAFVDKNGDGRWSPGSLIPFVPPEPIGWSVVEEPVRSRWETVLPDSLFIIDN